MLFSDTLIVHVYCMLYANCIMIMLSVSVYLLSLYILLFLWALSPKLKRMYDVWCIGIKYSCSPGEVTLFTVIIQMSYYVKFDKCVKTMLDQLKLSGTMVSARSLTLAGGKVLNRCYSIAYVCH